VGASDPSVFMAGKIADLVALKLNWRRAQDAIPSDFDEKFRSRFGHMPLVMRYIERRPKIRRSVYIVTDVDIELYHVDFCSYV
jgi:hypothetical protein